MYIPDPVLPKGSLVLVTGVTGFLGSHVADQLLLAGYKVRGAVRSPEKGKSLQQLFDSRYGTGNYETAIVKDIVEDGAFDEAIKGPPPFFSHFSTSF